MEAFGSDLRLYGTRERRAEPLDLVAGQLGCKMLEGVVVAVSWGGVEVIRAIDTPIRDAGWGTARLVETGRDLRRTDDEFHLRRRFRGGGFAGEITVSGSSDGRLDLSLRLTAEGLQEVSRAGFVVLHPLGVAGQRLEIGHSDGSCKVAAFPPLINPTHPAKDIVSLAHRLDGVDVAFHFGGEVFEMEDQRNWSDASFKTYCRPLLRPYPFAVKDGDTITQSIAITLSGAAQPAAAPARGNSIRAIQGTVPRFGLAIDPGWPENGRLGQASTVLPTLPRLARVDAEVPAHLDWLAGQAGPLDLEIVVDQDRDRMAAGLQRAVTALNRAGLRADRVTVLPRAWLACIQPWQPRPQGATLAEAAAAARRAFPQAGVGTGVLTNFVELNRARPDAAAADHVTHALTPLVHAADDDSVMATLDSLGPIADTLRAIYPDVPLRLGLAAIGMRSNPYGTVVAENPDQVRMAMAGADPRQRGLFAAAFAVGVAASPLVATSEFVALGAPYGPFGLAIAPAAWPQPPFDDRPDLVVVPIYHAVRALAEMAGRARVPVDLPAPVRGIAARQGDRVGLVAANCSDRPCRIDLPQGARLRILDEAALDRALADPDWLVQSPAVRATAVTLPAFAILFAEQDGGATDDP